jgi:opacity protein-like surface antigen
MKTERAAVLAMPLSTTALAQEPVGPPPPSGAQTGSGPDTYELLPDIGRIGAQVTIFAGGSWNPYEVGRGIDVGGAIDLPLARTRSGKLSYSISLALSLAETDPFRVTSAVALVANLAAGASLDDALAGPPRAPFPVVREVRTRLRLLHLSPFSLKYTFTGLDRTRLRPWVGAGLDFVVTITQEVPERDESLLFSGTAPFDAPLIAGLIAQAPELAERGSPTGQGNIEVGGHVAAGLELRVTSGLSLNLEYRFTLSEGRNAQLQTATAGVGFHW